MRPSLAALLALLSACQDLSPDCRCGTKWTASRLSCSAEGRCEGNFELVGHSDLMRRGMNSAIAIAGDYAYIGSRTDGHGVWHEHAEVLIVDIADPANPQVVGAIGPPAEGVIGLSSRELRAVPDKNLLIVQNLVCAGGGHISLFDCGQDWNQYPTTGGVAETANFKLYDITDRVNPVHVGTFDLGYHPDSIDRPSNPHEFFLWRDPADPDRLLVYSTAIPGDPDLRVIDVSDPTRPTLLLGFDTFQQGDAGSPEPVNVLHSVSASDDGRILYLAQFGLGFWMLDSSAIAMNLAPEIGELTPRDAHVDYSPPYNFPTHSAVPVPGRDLVLLTDEVFPVDIDAGCPWGWGWMVDVSDPARPQLFTTVNDDDEVVVLGQLRISENDPDRCQPAEVQSRRSFSAHNPTLTQNLALVSWYGGGLQAFDISQPSAPVQVGAFHPPDPPPAVLVEEPALGRSDVIMWSFPVVKDGLIYVVDIRNGLYVLRYTGPYAEEIAGATFLEGNSNLRGPPPVLP